MITTELSDLTLDEWQAFAHSQPDRTIFHHRNWVELLVDTYGFELHIPAVKQNGQILAAVPFVETRNLWGAPKLISLPFTDCMSILAKSDDAVEKLREGLTAGQYRRYRAIVLRTEKTFQSNRSAQWGRHVIDTSRPLNEITANFERTLRTNLRRAEKRKLTFEFSNDRTAFEEFSRLFLWTRRRHGVPVQPKSFFRGLYDRILLCNLGTIGLVKDRDTTIAAGVFLDYGGKMMCKYLASDPNALDNRPNEFLLYQAIRMAVETNRSTFDFGISRREQVGLRRFKRKFGAIENDVHNDCIAGDTKPPIEHSRAMKIVSSAIRNSPAFVGQALGTLFYRYSQ
jgi:lipid II:glycine glycyltransferase (peptidoglycan interpeptide bridge formation enzyme)